MKFTSNEFAGGLVEHLRRNGQLSNSSTNKSERAAFKLVNKQEWQKSRQVRSKQTRRASRTKASSSAAVNEAAGGATMERPKKSQKRKSVFDCRGFTRSFTRSFTAARAVSRTALRTSSGRFKRATASGSCVQWPPFKRHWRSSSSR